MCPEGSRFDDQESQTDHRPGGAAAHVVSEAARCRDDGSLLEWTRRDARIHHLHNYLNHRRSCREPIHSPHGEKSHSPHGEKSHSPYGEKSHSPANYSHVNLRALGDAMSDLQMKSRTRKALRLTESVLV